MHGGGCTDHCKGFRKLYDRQVSMQALPYSYLPQKFSRTSPPAESRKWGVYYVVGLILKCYFRARTTSVIYWNCIYFDHLLPTYRLSEYRCRGISFVPLKPIPIFRHYPLTRGPTKCVTDRYILYILDID